MNYSLLWKPKQLYTAVHSRLAQRNAFNQAVVITRKRFESDPEYRLDQVADNFKPRPGSPQDDSAILKRIVAAYQKAKVDQASKAEAFNVSNEWLHIYRRQLGSVMDSLLAGDIPALQQTYGNFFRDPCSAGLVGLPVDTAQHYLGPNIEEKYKRYALGDNIHRFHLWKERTHNAVPTNSLACPLVGNPYGYTRDGVFIRSGADYHHYYALTLHQLLSTGSGNAVVELGGGFGGMGYFLLRDDPSITYIDFDLPEAIALASYYIMKSLPDRHVTLYGEADLGAPMTGPGIFLMPSFEIEKLPAKSIAVSFNSYSLAEMSPSTIGTYLDHIARITNGSFLHVNHTRKAVLNADDFGIEDRGFRLVRRELAGWTVAVNPDSDEYEFLYTAAKQ